jgi:undecaprenyl-diphosphatase
MNFFYSIILGGIEGFTEFLPISSTAHLILFSRIFQLKQSDFLKTFIIFIQFGAILGLFSIYWRKFLTDIETLKRIFFAFVPTAIIGLLLYRIIKNFFFEDIHLILASLFMGGILLIIFEIYYQKKMLLKKASNDISYQNALLIGLGQALAVIPGVSRSAATILTGLLLGIERKTIVEFSFLLSIPTITTAALYDFYKNFHSFTLEEFDLLIVGFLSSFVFAILAAKFLLAYIKTHSFILFGIYRIILSLLLAFYFLR